MNIDTVFSVEMLSPFASSETDKSLRAVGTASPASSGLLREQFNVKSSAKDGREASVDFLATSGRSET